MEKLESSKQKNPVKAIRAYCLKCCLESSYEVARCTTTECELYAFRFGKNPYREKRELSEEQRQMLVERLKNAKAMKIAENSP